MLGQNNRALRILSMYLLISGGLSSQYGAPSRGSGGAGGFGGSSGGYGGASGGNYTHEVTATFNSTIHKRQWEKYLVSSRC